MRRFRWLCLASRSRFGISVLLVVGAISISEFILRTNRLRFADGAGDPTRSYAFGVSCVLAPCVRNRCQDENAEERKPVAGQFHGSEISGKTFNGASTGANASFFLGFAPVLDQFNLVAFWRVDKCYCTGAS